MSSDVRDMKCIQAFYSYLIFFNTKLEAFYSSLFDIITNCVRVIFISWNDVGDLHCLVKIKWGC